MTEKKPLSSVEWKVLAELLERARWPFESSAFDALSGVTVADPIELLVFNDQGQISMSPRADKYVGLHMPGTVLRDNEDVPTAIKRLVARELPGADVTPPLSLGWKEVHKGTGEGENPYRHEISLIHSCHLREPWKDSEFFDPANLPDNTLSHHKLLIGEAMARLSRK